jgi:hypothetical protein
VLVGTDSFLAEVNVPIGSVPLLLYKSEAKI